MQNYFQILKLPEVFDIDLAELERNYFNLQIEYHPDRALNIEDRGELLVMSTKLNEAYENLKDDFKRAKALLTVLGVNFNDEELKSNLDKEFLQAKLDEFEFINSAQDTKELSEMLIAKYLEKKELITSLIHAFKSRELDTASKRTISLRYVDNIIDQIKNKLQNTQHV
ncbi:Putative co-chaperone HscB [Candidatus Phycorickettsia trachydisci]|uniref:Co-chaperone HscB n=1 Tax=Candidatus Phycorickettsia trachydisci TaxID=2115978 RepID=A0A2P1P862_9RICK|nr:Fe-S protein assembly co-chaperone HscB [Candidatus Phycorickettsia trachydisci]AVP87444.1 Putative co-chaperone HscB [Candidatus Phycorickettsia trachydisci]